MNRLMPAVSMLLAFVYATLVFAQQPDSDKLSPDQKKLIETAKSLSATTLVDGPGWQNYETYLHENFNRWSEGNGVWDRDRSIEIIKQWWKDGNRVKTSNDELISIQLVGSTAVIRRKMSETFVDKEGKQTGSFSGFVTQVWVLKQGDWKLLSATIQAAKKP